MICALLQTKQAWGGPVVLRPVYRRSPGSHWLAVQSGTSAGWGPARTWRHRPGSQPDRQPQGRKQHQAIPQCPLSHFADLLSLQRSLQWQQRNPTSKTSIKVFTAAWTPPFPFFIDCFLSQYKTKGHLKPHQDRTVNSKKLIALKYLSTESSLKFSVQQRCLENQHCHVCSFPLFSLIITTSAKE